MKRTLCLLTIICAIIIWWQLRRGPADRNPGLPASFDSDHERERFMADVEAYLEGHHGNDLE